MFNYQTSKGMEEKFNFTQLLQKPIAMMTGEELCFLIGKSVESIEKPTSQATSKGNYYGIEGIDRKSTRLNSSHNRESRMPSSA